MSEKEPNYKELYESTKKDLDELITKHNQMMDLLLNAGIDFCNLARSNRFAVR